MQAESDGLCVKITLTAIKQVEPTPRWNLKLTEEMGTQDPKKENL